MSISLGTISTIVQAVVMWAPAVQALWTEAVSNDDFITKLEKLAPGVAPLIQSIGSELFPKASSTLQTVAGVVAAFDPNTTKWLQGSINAILKPATPLVVDGIYGKATIAAVEQLQTKLGLSADGIAGQITQAAIATALTKLVPTL